MLRLVSLYRSQTSDLAYFTSSEAKVQMDGYNLASTTMGGEGSNLILI
jgi:hypothetical protein